MADVGMFAEEELRSMDRVNNEEGNIWDYEIWVIMNESRNYNPFEIWKIVKDLKEELKHVKEDNKCISKAHE